MLNPLLLPIGKDLHRSEQTAFAKVQQFLFAEGHDMRLLSLLFPVFDICLKDDHAELELLLPLAFLLLI